ncbi:MAG: tRNA (adenosine(37)-N6)-threonylcarbamoyltransferase complex ATPase subunit type 1 TsaE [Phycisphaerae bacterium]|nr:tRNA (adenosine(37)-N6)-threonylcarbamoyltransferase complex ATPase subunit type 1 TsaE [Phycisphaerae bacterium]
MIRTISLTSAGPAATEAIATRLALGLQGGDVVALSGPLGAGKTCFVRGLARGLGLDSREVSSPTFVLRQEYVRGTVRLAHLDAYRLGGEEELESVGWDELLAERDAIIAVEWPERIAASLPEARIDVALVHDGPSSRTIVVKTALPGRLHGLVGGHGRCPTCGRPVPGGAADFPFCTTRCRDADLHGWLSERFAISDGGGDE